MRSAALTNPWRNWIVFRTLFGVYLAASFLHFYLDAGEFVFPGGITPERSIFGFPNLLFYLSESAAVKSMAVIGMILSVCFASGKYLRGIVLVLWYLWFCFHNRIYFMYLPSEGFVGWILLGMVFFSPEKSGGSQLLNRDFYFRLLPLAWLVVGMAYSYSGYSKLISPIWQSGFAFREMLSSPEFRQWLTQDVIDAVPDFIYIGINWFTVLIELFALPLVLINQSRRLWWIFLCLLHMGVFCVDNIPGITMAMLCVQLFLLINIQPDFKVLFRSPHNIDGAPCDEKHVDPRYSGPLM